MRSVIMGFRFNRRIRIAPGIRVNIGKRGWSLSLGGRGAWTTIGRQGVRNTIGIPGTGLSYTHRIRARQLGSGIITLGVLAGVGWLAVSGLLVPLLKLALAVAAVWLAVRVARRIDRPATLTAELPPELRAIQDMQARRAARARARAGERAKGD